VNRCGDVDDPNCVEVRSARNDRCAAKGRCVPTRFWRDAAERPNRLPFIGQGT
jgi:hypothetical protein